MVRHHVETPEGVRLSLELAGAGSRMVAALLDGVRVAVTFALLAVIVRMTPFSVASELLNGMLVAGGLVILVVSEAVAHQIGDGQTPGKRVMGLRVVSADGSPASRGQLWMRSLFLPLEWIPLPLPFGLVVICATPRRQRLGDLAADTLCIRRDEGFSAAEPFPEATWSGLERRAWHLTPGMAAHLDGADRSYLRELLARSDLDRGHRRSLFVRTARHYADRLGLGPFDDARVVLRELYLFAREHRD